MNICLIPTITCKEESYEGNKFMHSMSRVEWNESMQKCLSQKGNGISTHVVFYMVVLNIYNKCFKYYNSDGRWNILNNYNFAVQYKNT
jgi:hypothetical protein